MEVNIKINYHDSARHGEEIKDVWVGGARFVADEYAPLPNVQWAALARAEKLLYGYGGGYGYNAWTDVCPNDGSQLLNLLWDQAELATDQATPDALAETARRVAAALAILSFGKDFLLK